MFIPLVKRDYKWSSGLGDGGGVFWSMFSHCPGERAQIPVVWKAFLRLSPVQCHLLSFLPLALQIGLGRTEVLRVLWTLFSLCTHTFPLPERSLKASSSPPCFDLIPCAAFLCVPATGPLPLTDFRAFPPSVLQRAHPSRQRVVHGHSLVNLFGHIMSSLRTGPPTWPKRTVYGEKLWLTRD